MWVKIHGMYSLSPLQGIFNVISLAEEVYSQPVKNSCREFESYVSEVQHGCLHESYPLNYVLIFVWWFKPTRTKKYILPIAQHGIKSTNISKIMFEAFKPSHLLPIWYVLFYINHPISTQNLFLAFLPRIWWYHTSGQ